MKKQTPVDLTTEKQALVHGGSGLLILITVYCTIGAVVSSFSLPVVMSTMFFVWLVSTVIITSVTVYYRGKGLLILILPVLVLFLLSSGSIINGGMWTINEITTLFGRWLPIPELFPDAKDLIDDPGVFIAALGVVLTLLLAFSICLRRSAFITLLITAPLVFLTFVITDLQPDLFYMFGIIAVYLTLLISSAFNPDSFIKRGIMFMPAFAVALMIMLTAYIFAPHGSYAREEHIAALGNRFRTVASQMGRFGQFWHSTGGSWGFNWFGTFDIGLWHFNTQNVSIADSGNRVFSDQSLLEVTASEPGTYYLRGFSMQDFDGRSWNHSNETHVYNEVTITWPSIFSGLHDYLRYDAEDHSMPITTELLIHRIGVLRSERRNIQGELVTLVIPLEDEEQERIREAEVEEMNNRLNEIELELEPYLEELFNRYNPSVTQIHSVDISLTMPAFLAEFYYLSNIDNLPVPVEMEINRTGDITAGISYLPYYGGVFAGDNLIGLASSTRTFFNVRGSVLRLADVVSESFTNNDTIDADGIIRTSINLDAFPDGAVIITRDLEEYVIYESTIHDFPDNDILDAIFPVDALHSALSNYAFRMQALGLYTQVEPSTGQALRQLAIDAGIDPNADRAVIADAVVRYVMASGEYTLTPEQIPEDEDFALYFLQESQGGYCIHYATAAVLMLRSLDIPARFTSGYVVTVPPGQAGNRLVLTDRNAHAWVEVFYDNVGWLYLEATPSGGNPFIPEPRPHTPELDDISTDTQSPGQTGDDFIDYPSEDDFGPWDDMNGYQATPGTGSSTQQNLMQLPSWVFNIVVSLISLVSAIIILVIRRNVVKRLRKKNFEQSNTNKAVISMWRYIERLGRREVVAPDEIEELALKARFSQHQITEDERAVMMTYVKKLAYDISSGKGDYSRLWLKYIRALC